MKLALICLTVLIIISQAIHTFYVFNAFSRIEDRQIKRLQSIMFCLILSVSILIFVLLKRPNLALFGAVIEWIINVYYYAMDFFKDGIRARVKRKESIITYWRKNWIAQLFGFIMPLIIYIFSHVLTEL